MKGCSITCLSIYLTLNGKKYNHITRCPICIILNFTTTPFMNWAIWRSPVHKLGNLIAQFINRARSLPRSWTGHFHKLGVTYVFSIGRVITQSEFYFSLISCSFYTQALLVDSSGIHGRDIPRLHAESKWIIP